QAAALQDLGGGVEGALRGRPPLPLDGDLAHGPEEPGRLGIVEVLGLGHEGDAPAQDQGQEDGVAERQVVAGQNGGTVGGDVLGTLDPHPEQETEYGGQNGLYHPIRHCPQDSWKPSPADFRGVAMAWRSDASLTGRSSGAYGSFAYEPTPHPPRAGSPAPADGLRRPPLRRERLPPDVRGRDRPGHGRGQGRLLLVLLLQGRALPRDPA